MQRTTVRLPLDLLDDAKRHARRSGRSLTQLIEDAVRVAIAQPLGAEPLRVAEGSVRYNKTQGNEASVVTYPTVKPLEGTERVRERLQAQIADIQAFVSALPDLDTRSPEDILGYNDRGHFE